MQLPSGFEAQVAHAPVLAAKHGVTVLNSPGTIDADYRGEIKVILINLGDAPVTLARGDRIAQMVDRTGYASHLAEVATLEETDRGAGGFGSTGTKGIKGGEACYELQKNAVRDRGRARHCLSRRAEPVQSREITRRQGIPQRYLGTSLATSGPRRHFGWRAWPTRRLSIGARTSAHHGRRYCPLGAQNGNR